jgi:ubiquinone/menaquinone biosynthesis C-methylase UbiE
VTAIDYVSSLLELGRARAAAEGLPVTFLEGDAEEIAFPDHAFRCRAFNVWLDVCPESRKGSQTGW